MQRIFLISGTLLVIILILWGVYAGFFRANPYNPTVESGTVRVTQQSEVPKASQSIFSGAPIQTVVDEPVISAAIDGGDQYLWYVTMNGHTLIRKEILSGAIETLLTFGYVPNQVRFSPSFNQALVQERSTTGEKWHLVDLHTKADTLLKNGLKSPVWTNTGDRIVYEYDVAKDATLNLSQPDGSEWKKLANISAFSVAISVIPKTSLVAAWNIPSAFTDTKLQTLSLAGGDPQTVFSGRFGVDYLFSPDGTKVLIASTDRKGGNNVILGVANINGGEYRTLDIPTFINKVVWGWDSKTVYWAVPGGFPEGTVLPDDYKQKSVFSTDAFWKADILTGKKERLVELPDIKQEFDATRLFIDAQEQFLFFVNRRDNKLYRVKI